MRTIHGNFDIQKYEMENQMESLGKQIEQLRTKSVE